MKLLRCAVIGVGYLGKFHAEKYASLPQVDLVGVCDTDANISAEVAKRCNTQSFTDYTHLIDQVDAVSIATPTSSHYAIAQACLTKGVHVLLEKPMTRTVAEAEELIQIAQSNRAILQIGHLERFNPAVVALEWVLQDRPLFIESRRISPFQMRGTDVNVILDLMIHDIDIIQAIVKSPIKRIDAIGAPVLSQYNDLANARLQFENGCIANVSASRVSMQKERHMRIFQRTSFVSIDLQNKNIAVYRKGTGEMFPGIPDIISEQTSYENSDPLLAEIIAFIESIREHKPPKVSGEDGKQALATAIAITEAIKDHANTIVMA